MLLNRQMRHILVAAFTLGVAAALGSVSRSMISAPAIHHWPFCGRLGAMRYRASSLAPRVRPKISPESPTTPTGFQPKAAYLRSRGPPKPAFAWRDAGEKALRLS